ncbi:VHS1111 protein [Vibrio phage 1]|nr:VHS1111 protein [Vibrio phage 1]
MCNTRRYSPTVSDKRGFNGEAMEQRKNGNYVLYTTHANVVNSLQRRIRALEKKLANATKKQ